MENPEGVLNLLDEFAKVKSKEIPNDLEEYLLYVAASGDPVYQWSLIKSLYRQKLINVITDFYENSRMMDIPSCPNVDSFNYETMKNSLLERLDSFASAPFTIQRISELLTTPTKQYNRVDKFMRAIEKNIWVVSTREPGQREQATVQDASGNLVNGVSPRVRVTVKHPKRGKSIEERIKSGHSQLIDDDEEEEEEKDDAVEEKAQSELLTNNESEDTPLQCTSVKDLLEKYENGTIFCGTEEKTVQLEEPAIAGEANTSEVSEEEREPKNSENTAEQDNDEEVNIDKLVTPEECPRIELAEASEGEKLKDTENKENIDDVSMPLVEDVKNKENDGNDTENGNENGNETETEPEAETETETETEAEVEAEPEAEPETEAEAEVETEAENDNDNENDTDNDVAMPLVEDMKEDTTSLTLSECCPTESTNFCSDAIKPDITDQSNEVSTSNEDSEGVTVMEVMGLDNEVETNETTQVENM